MTLSLHARVLLAASIVLAAFLGLTGLVLDNAFRDSAETALHNQLQTHVHALLAAAELDTKDVIRLPPELPEARFATAGSGLYADVASTDNVLQWRSPSSLGMEFPLIQHPSVGERVFQYITTNDGVIFLTYSFGVSWENSQDKHLRYTFRVIESLDGFHAQLQRFRRSLWGWLGGVVLLLLAVQGTILRWGLAPLRQVTDDLTEIESGRARKLTRDYPKELRGLTSNLNALIASAQAHLIRYRDSLGNLAHSLKTPLAVLHGAVENTNSDSEQHRIIQEQVIRMTEIIEYQLQRASAAGRTVLAAPVSVLAKTNQVVAALTKVYAEKSVDCDVVVDKDLMFYGDEGDLLEILGNLADNAFKWCRHRVTISARPLESSLNRPARLEIRIEDDGNGIPQEVTEQIQQRGMRADPSTAGHGLGLAMVREILEAYHGELKINQSVLGGAAVIITL